jgi:hypothetical protein
LCEGNIGNPLVLEEFQWDNKWVDNQKKKDREEGDLAWAHVDDAIGASSSLRGHNFPRARVGVVYSRCGSAACGASMDEEEHLSSNEDNDQDDEEYFARDDEVDDFGESLHNSPTQDGVQVNAVMDHFDLDDI